MRYHGNIIIVSRLHFGSDLGLKGRQKLVAVGTHSINTSRDACYILLCVRVCFAWWLSLEMWCVCEGEWGEGVFERLISQLLNLSSSLKVFQVGCSLKRSGKSITTHTIFII